MGIDLQTIGVERDVDTTGVPEAGIVADESIDRCVDEDVQQHPFAVVIKLVGHHLADLHASIRHWRADIERAEVFCVQLKVRARLTHGYRGR